MTKATIHHCAEDAELYRHYDGQSDSQSAYIELDLEDGVMLADYDAVVGNGVPPEVHHGRTRRYPIPVLTATAAGRVMEELLPLAQRVLNGSEVVWDGSNNVAVLDDDATAAEEEIMDRLGSDESAWEPDLFDHEDLVDEWNIDGATNGNEVEEYGITAETSDERLEEIERGILADLAEVSESGVVVCHGLLEHLERLREDVADEDPATPAEVTLTREYLGMTGDHLAARLGVNPRTLRSWEQGRDEVPGRVTIELARYRQHADGAVADMVAKHSVEESPVLTTYRTKLPEGVRLPWTVRQYGAGWHRAITARAAAQLPGARITFAGDDE